MVSFEEVTPIKFESRSGNPIIYSPDGRIIATSSAGFSVLLLNSATLEPIRKLAGHQAAVIDLAFDPDGARIASASYDRTVGVWDVADGALLAMLRGHSDRVHCVAFSPDGARIASGSNDKTIRLWDTVTYNEVAQLRGHTDHVWSLAWSPDSQWLVSGSGDYQVRIWDTEPMSTRLAAAKVRKQIVARIEQKVKAAFAQSADPSEAVAHLRDDPSLKPPEREVALQMVLGLAVEARDSRAQHAESDEP